MWIQNASYHDIEKGTHFYPGSNCLLIQIVDKDLGFPIPKYNFKLTRQYEFADIETTDDDHEITGITDGQAVSIIADLELAKINSMNVIVHCVAGLCRSGAVVDVAVQMGFDDPKIFRAPNLLVKHKLMKVLGWTYE